MTADGQNNISGNPSDETQPQPAIGAVEEVAGGQSRRKFLRLAVVSGATVATVGATAGIAAAHPHTGILTNLGVTNPFGASHANPTCILKLEGTELDGNCFTSFTYNHGSGSTTPGQLYLFFTVHNLPPGSYIMTITRDGTHDVGDAPWSYSGSNSAKLYQYAKNGATDCPNFGGTLPTNQVRKANTVPLLFTKPPQSAAAYSFSGSNADLQISVHLNFNGKAVTGTHIYKFVGVIKDSDGNTICTTPELDITATQDK